MKRLYSISKKISDEDKQEIEKELNALDYVTVAEITEEGLILDTADGDFTEAGNRAVNIAGNRAVNIFARNGGAVISFQRFIYDE